LRRFSLKKAHWRAERFRRFECRVLDFCRPDAEYILLISISTLGLKKSRLCVCSRPFARSSGKSVTKLVTEYVFHAGKGAVRVGEVPER